MSKFFKIGLLIIAAIAVMGQAFTLRKYAITGGTTQRSDADRWNDRGVNVLEFGADPTGTVDSTVAFQAAIDSLSGTAKKVVYCPDGFYKTSLPLYLDPPGNLRSGSAWSSGTTYASGNIVKFNGIIWKSLTNGNLNNTPSITSTKWTPWVGTASVSQFSYTLTGNPPQMGTGNNQSGCSIQPTFNNAPVIIVGTGSGMVVANMNITFGRQGGSVLYRGAQPSLGIGIAIAGDGGGAQRSMISDVEVDNFYTAFLTGFGSDGLGAENKFVRDVATNCFQGIVLSNSQNFINDVEEGNIGCTIGFTAAVGHGMAVRDTNPSVAQGHQAIFTISSVSMSDGASGGPPADTLTATFDSSAGSDTNITSCQTNNPNNASCIYSVFIVQLPGFGPVPFNMTGYNYSTRVATFNLNLDWRLAHFEWNSLATGQGTDFQTEMNAATTMYAVEKVTIFSGIGFHGENLHVENGLICQTFFNGSAGFGGDYGNSFKEIHFNQTPGLDEQNDTNVTHSNPLFGQYLCQQSTPLISIGNVSGNVTFESMGWGQQPGFGDSPFIIDYFPSGAARCRFISEGGSIPLNPVIFTLGFGQAGFYDAVQGLCDWQSPVYGANPSVGSSQANLYTMMQQMEADGEYGYFPKPGNHPRLPVDMFTTLQSITSSNAIGSYPVIYGNVVYIVNDPVADTTGGGTPPVAKFVQSNHLMGSYGRNLTTSDWAGLSWKYVAGGNVVMADTTTLTHLFPGLVINLNNGSGAVKYMVREIHPHDTLDGGTHPGYFTVCNVNAMTSSGGFNIIEANGPIACVTSGTVGTTYTGTTIGQDAFVWKSTTLQ